MHEMSEYEVHTRAAATRSAPATLLHKGYQLAVHDRVAVQVRLERVHVRHVVRVQRRGQAHHHDHQEQEQGGHGDAVPPQPPRGQPPRVAADDGRLQPGINLYLLQQRSHARTLRTCPSLGKPETVDADVALRTPV